MCKLRQQHTQHTMQHQGSWSWKVLSKFYETLSQGGSWLGWCAIWCLFWCALGYGAASSAAGARGWHWCCCRHCCRTAYDDVASLLPKTIPWPGHPPYPFLQRGRMSVSGWTSPNVPCGESSTCRGEIAFGQCDGFILFVVPTYGWWWLCEPETSWKITQITLAYPMGGMPVAKNASMPSENPCRRPPCCWMHVSIVENHFATNDTSNNIN